MEIIRIDAARWGITSPVYNKTLHVLAKETPGMTWAPQHRAWIGYGDAVRVLAKKLKKEGRRPTGKLPRRRDVAAEGEKAKARVMEGLRLYQKKGVRFLVKMSEHGALLADDVGLGKTSQTLRAIESMQETTVVVSPSFVRSVWHREAAKWLPDWPVIDLLGTACTCGHGHVMHRREGVKCAHKCKTCKGIGKVPKMTQLTMFGEPEKKPKMKPCAECDGTGLGCDCTAFKLDSADVDELFPSRPALLLINYDIIHAWEKWLVDRAPKIVVADEAHMLMSYKARRSISFRNIARAAERRIGLSATPMTSRPRDLWNIVDTLSPGRFGKSFPYLLRYAGAHQVQVSTDKTVWDTKGSSNLEELAERMKFFMLRRTKKQVALELPPLTRQIIELEVAAGFCLPTRQALGGDQALRAALNLAADGKLPQAIEIIANHARSDNNVVVFCHRKWIAQTIQAALEKQKINAAVITGQLPMRKRTRIVDSQPRVLCCTMDSTGVGVDLSYANVAVFVELDYVPSKLLQSEGRVVRFGQKRNILIQYLIALSSSDEIIRDVVLNKMETFENVVGKIDGGLKTSLEGDSLDDVAQLKKLYEKILRNREEE